MGQNGDYVEVFNIQRKECTENWKLSSPYIKKVYDRKAKGYVLSLIGNTITTWMQLPSDMKEGLNLLQSLLIFQLLVSKNKNFSMEVIIALASGDRKHIVVSTSQKNMQVTPTFAKIPLMWEQKGTWLNLCFDLDVLTSDFWKGQTFSFIECIIVRASCQLKRIFTLNKSCICLPSYKYLKQHLLSFLPSQFIMPGVYDVCLIDSKSKESLDICKESEQFLSSSYDDKYNCLENDVNAKQKICEEKIKKCDCNKKHYSCKKHGGKTKTNKKENNNNESNKVILQSKNSFEKLKTVSKLEESHLISNYNISNQYYINKPYNGDFACYSPTKYSNILKTSDNMKNGKVDTSLITENYIFCSKNFSCDQLQNFYDDKEKECNLTKENISANKNFSENWFKTINYNKKSEEIKTEDLLNEFKKINVNEEIVKNDLSLQAPNDTNEFEINISKIDNSETILTKEYDKNKYVSTNNKDLVCLNKT
ncbi:uncharacterized protein PF3D7_1120600-like isoform X2 [Centruroides vittatus]|uniref:uncharacterized protein PF3D7_1120600-like isoform X2 n=1 Tax=Centruroides vittatus TaxID=120091 RepID=UPI00350FA22A